MSQIGLGPIKNHVNQMTRLTDLELYIKLRTSMDVGAVSIWQDPRKSKMWRDSAHGAIAQ